MPDIFKRGDILIVGVGGQGTLLAGRVIGDLAAASGADVKVSEVHGMSQRGGSVVTYVRYADKVASPLIERGGADLIIAFEPLEAARWLGYLKPGGGMAVNKQRIDPMPVINGAAIYPEGLEDYICGRCGGAFFIDALSAAAGCGSVRAVNFVLLGAVSASLEFTKDEWLEVMRESTPSRALEVNTKAFLEGARLRAAMRKGVSPPGETLPGETPPNAVRNEAHIDTGACKC